MVDSTGSVSFTAAMIFSQLCPNRAAPTDFFLDDGRDSVSDVTTGDSDDDANYVAVLSAGDSE